MRRTSPMKIVFLMSDNAGTAGRHELLNHHPDEYGAILGPTLIELQQPAYRARQIAGWVHERFAAGFNAMTDLPADLRTRLDERFSVSPLEMAFQARSRDGTVKHLWRLRDGEQVESVERKSNPRPVAPVASRVSGWPSSGNLAPKAKVAKTRPMNIPAGACHRTWPVKTTTTPPI